MTSKIETNDITIAAAIDSIEPTTKKPAKLSKREKRARIEAAAKILTDNGINATFDADANVIFATDTGKIDEARTLIGDENITGIDVIPVIISGEATEYDPDTVVIGKYTITATKKSSRRKLRKFAKKSKRIDAKRTKLELKVEAALAAVPEPVTFNDRAAIEKKFSRKRIKLAKKQDRLDAKLAKHINKDLTKTIKAAALKGE